MTTFAYDADGGPSLLGRVLRQREVGVFIALAVLVAAISIARPNFLASGNLFIMSRQIALTAIAAIGVFFVILTAGIDLSVGSAVGLTGYVCGLAFAAGAPAPVALLAAIGCGALIGAINGFVVAYVGVTSFIITLGMLEICRSTIYTIRHGDSIRGIPESFVKMFGTGEVLGVSSPVIVLILLAVVSHIVLNYTAFGRRVYAIGGNEEATKLSGINVRRVKFMTYVLCSVCCAVAGILFVAYGREAHADTGKDLELDAIAAAVIGGTSLMGGQGTVLGVLIGATIMGVVKNGLVLLDVSSYWQQMVIGIIIVAAAIIDVVQNANADNRKAILRRIAGIFGRSAGAS
jgi:ribose transport system permease protein